MTYFEIKKNGKLSNNSPHFLRCGIIEVVSKVACAMPYLEHQFELKKEQFLPLDINDVFSFFKEASNLEVITPPELNFSILTPMPLPMKEKQIIDYRISLMGVPFYWKTLIEKYEPPHFFIDTQLKGPYRLWRHLHLFEEVEGGVKMTDHVFYSLPFGFLGKLAHWLFVRRKLKRIFDYRETKIKEVLLCS